jgi:hypothetical protein
MENPAGCPGPRLVAHPLVVREGFTGLLWYAARRHGLTLPYPIRTSINIRLAMSETAPGMLHPVFRELYGSYALACTATPFCYGNVAKLILFCPGSP